VRVLEAPEVAACSPYSALVAALRAGLDDTLVVPERGAFDLTGRGDSLLTMPAWRRGGLGGVKIATVHPRNPAANLPSVQAQFFAFDTATGTPLALLDGTTLTNRRTAAVSALAVELLARPDARRLLIVGAGALARALAAAHLGVRVYEGAALYARDPAKSRAAVEALSADGLALEAADDLARAIGRADVIVAATTATTPFIRGSWVRPGAHVCLMGAFTTTMAEADAALLGAARLFADTRAGVVAKGGEVAQAIAAGMLAPEAIEDDLFGLVRRAAPVARGPQDVTVFKSVGSAAFDLVAAELVLLRA
jgi:ornithine cyclodeaminase